MDDERADGRLQALQRENDDLRARVAELERELENRPPSAPGKTRRSAVRTVGNVVFYAAMALILVGALLARSAQSGAPVNIGGYSGMLVLSESMQEAIPKGSLIVTRSVDPATLEVGDDVTFLVNPTTTVTHRIVGIQPQDDGTLAFTTKGVSNPSPDSAPVHESNLVGKVIFHSLPLGLAAKAVSDNWPLLLFLLAVLTVLEWVLKRILSDKKTKQAQEPPAEQESAAT